MPCPGRSASVARHGQQLQLHLRGTDTNKHGKRGWPVKGLLHVQKTKGQVRWNWKCDGPKDTTFIPVQNHSSNGLAVRTVSTTRDNGSATEGYWPRTLSQASLRINELEVCICFTRENVQRPGLIVSAIAEIESHGTLASAAEFAHLSVSHQALWSFATMFFGIQNRHPHITRRGYAMYGAALAHLNQELDTMTCGTSDEVMNAVATLAIAELLMPSGRNNYLNHIMGLQKLIGLTEPSMFWPAKPYGFRNGVRFMLVLASLQNKSPCILARPEWSKALRINISAWEEKDQDIWDVLADLTVLLAKREAMFASDSSDVEDAAQQIRELKAQGHALLARLQTCKSSAEAAGCTRTSTTPTVPPILDAANRSSACNRAQSSPTKPTPTSRAHLMYSMLLHATSLYVLQFLASPPITPPPTPSPIPPTPTTHPTHQAYASLHRTAAQQTARSARAYLEQKKWAVDAKDPPILHLAIGAAWGSLRRDASAEGEWLRELMTGKGKGERVVRGGLWTTYKWVNNLGE